MEVPVLLDPGCRIGPADPAGHPAHPAGYDITFTLMLPWQHQSEGDAAGGRTADRERRYQEHRRTSGTACPVPEAHGPEST